MPPICFARIHLFILGSSVVRADKQSADVNSQRSASNSSSCTLGAEPLQTGTLPDAPWLLISPTTQDAKAKPEPDLPQTPLAAGIDVLAAPRPPVPLLHQPAAEDVKY